MVQTVRAALPADRILRAALWLILLSVVASTKTDPDLWGHVRFGMDMVRTMSIRQVDSYSFTSDRAWVNHEWAAESVFGAAFMLAGSAGLVATKVLIVLGVLALLNVRLRAEGVAASRLRDLLIALAVITTIEQAHNIRPQLFSLLFFSALVSCLQLSRRNIRYLTPLPIIFGLWANFHGGWIVGGGVLVSWALGLTLSGTARLRAMICYGAAGIASLAATLINPEGIGLLTFLRDTVGFGRADIVDWQPVYALGPNVVALWALTAIVAAFGIFAAWRQGNLPLERLFVVIPLAIGSFRVNRLLAFFALATLFLLGGAVASLLSRRQPAAAAPARRSTAAVAMTLATMLFVFAFRTLAATATCIEVDARTTAEPQAIEFLKREMKQGRLLVWFDWGQYALWHVGPAVRVSVDGRRETVYSASVQDRHLRFYFDSPGGATLPGDIDADYIWLPKDLPATRRLIAEGWPQLYVGETSIIFGRQPATSVPVSARALDTAPPPLFTGSRCFPNP